MTRFTERVYIVTASFDADQVGRVFDEAAADRVYLLTNEDPMGLSDAIKDEPNDRVRAMIEEKTTCAERDEIREVPTNYYEIEDPLCEAYRIIKDETAAGNDVFINISGGTKPVAIALAYAHSLANAGHLFYIPKKYKEDDEITAEGLTEKLLDVSALQSLNFADVIPTHEDQIDLVIGFLETEGPMGVTEVLSAQGIIEPSPPDDDPARKERNRIIQRYHRHANQLLDANIVTKTERKYTLTDTGRIVARLASIDGEVGGQSEQ